MLSAHLISSAAAGALLLCVAVHGQTDWSQRASSAPPARQYHAMAYDGARGVTVLFGGTGAAAYRDTWCWDGTTWTQKAPATSPTARAGHCMTYDAARARAVVFGGYTARGPVAEVHEWDGSNWFASSPVVNPPPRYYSAMAYDVVRRRVVAFGGWDQVNVFDDTWTWDGHSWTRVFPVTTPPRRSHHAMVFDAARGVIVMVGGGGLAGTLADTWEWDGVNWTQRNPLPAFPFTGRMLHAMAFDSARGRTLLFSGAFSSGTTGTVRLLDNLEWDGSNWIRRTTRSYPAARMGHAMAFDSARRQAVMFGGNGAGPLGDTWEYAPTSPADCLPFGMGCAGNGGTPSLAAEPWSLPWIAEIFAARVAGLGSGASILLLGDSKSLWGPFALPLALAPYGMPGCALQVNPVIAFGLANTGGSATWSLYIPDSASLVGQSLFAQGAVSSSGTNSAGVVVSNASELRLGAK